MVDLLCLGDQPLANSLKKNPSDDELKVPLTLSFCPESSLVQIRETVHKETLFSSYVWVSGTSATTREYAKKFARDIVGTAALRPDDLVLEIASNDGTFLKPFLDLGHKNILGVDPASNIVEMANKDGVRTLTQFWDRSAAEKVAGQYGKAKVIIARNVIPHVSELQDVMAGVELALKDDGIGVFEFHYAGEILDGLQYDSIYHEHLCYFSLASIGFLLKRFHLHLFHAGFSPISGGSLVVYFSKKKRERSPALAEIGRSEEARRINRLETWQEFAGKCAAHRQKSLELFSSLSQKTIIGFGTSARSSTYLNFCGFTNKQIKAAIDNNPLKQGQYAPGSSIPIVPFEEGLAMRPDLIFIFAWNFRD